MAVSDMPPTGDQEVAVSPPPGRQDSFVEINLEIFSTVILTLQLIQEGQLSVVVFRFMVLQIRMRSPLFGVQT